MYHATWGNWIAYRMGFTVNKPRVFVVVLLAAIHAIKFMMSTVSCSATENRNSET